ncbi:MAG: transposase [Gemmatimonadales bacterium]
MRRHDVRLKTFDYRSPGIYLVTLVTDLRARCLGRVAADEVVLSPFGEVVQRHLKLLPIWRPQVAVIDHVVMPDHVHVLLEFNAHVPAGLGGVVGCLKGGITRDVNLLRGTEAAAFWQHNYWERVVRSDFEVQKIREYFANNPRRWLAKHCPT